MLRFTPRCLELRTPPTPRCVDLGTLWPSLSSIILENYFFLQVVLSKMEKILAKISELSSDIGEQNRLEIVFDGRNESLSFYKVKVPKPDE